jgi:PncC family amidohydrolase
VGEFLASNNLSLSTMESDTGGFLANTITGIPESSTYFKGGLIASSTVSKITFGIDTGLIEQYGSASIEIAEAMATKAREVFNSNIGIGITGIITPVNSDNKTIGTIFISIDDGKIKHRFTRNSPGHYNQIKQRAAISALFELNKILIQGGTHALDY